MTIIADIETELRDARLARDDARREEHALLLKAISGGE